MLNPIKSVTPANSKGTATGATITDIPCPSGYQWDKEDISDEDAGRVTSGRMIKKRTGRVVKLGLVWNFRTLQECSDVLQAFASEYTNVEFLDAESGGYKTKTFYTGGIVSPLYNLYLGRWEHLTFNIIQSIPDKE